MRAYAATSTAILDTYALDMPDLFPAWATVLEAGEELPAGRILNLSLIHISGWDRCAGWF